MERDIVSLKIVYCFTESHLPPYPSLFFVVVTVFVLFVSFFVLLVVVERWLDLLMTFSEEITIISSIIL